MKFNKLPLKEAYLIDLISLADKRGFFERLYCQKEFGLIGFNKKIVQINYTFSKKIGTIRGLHFQKAPFTEAKVVTCLHGKVFDVIVDLRQKSPTYLKWHGEILSERNHKMLYIPEGFAHGLETLTDNCSMLYFHSNFYRKISESGIKYDDPSIGIKWPLELGIISKKDKKLPYVSKIFKGLK